MAQKITIVYCGKHNEWYSHDCSECAHSRALIDVGRWIERNLPKLCDTDGNFHLLLHHTELENLLNGKMP